MPSFGISRDAYIVCDSFKRLWREANSNISSYWDTLHNAILTAVGRPGTPFAAGPLIVQRDGSWLRIRLPSGRYLCYPGVRVNDNGEVSYLGVNQYTRRWDRIGSWKGKFFENVCQAGSRDVLYHPMQKMEDAGYKIVLHVHDEVVVEAPDTPEYNINRLDELLSEGTEWTKGLPLSAAGFETYRYRKG
jgi:DNA polymerase bacteriophage-type